jgi:hypothetical protein
LLVKRFFFLLNSAFAMAILDLISQVVKIERREIMERNSVPVIYCSAHNMDSHEIELEPSL